jgi:acetyltransferase
MMEQTRIYRALKGVRGRKPVDLPALEQLMVRFSELVAEQPAIREIDINPLLASADALIALDARVVLYPSGQPLPRLAIRPYPFRYEGVYTAPNGRTLTIRPIRPEDEPLMVNFHQKLSERTVYLRYMQSLQLDQRVAHERLTRICFIDYDRELALVAVDESPNGPEVVGVGRLVQIPGTEDREFALLIADHFQRQGLGSELLRRIIQAGKIEGACHITGEIHAENTPMISLCRKFGFTFQRSMGDPSVQVDLSCA